MEAQDGTGTLKGAAGHHVLRAGNLGVLTDSVSYLPAPYFLALIKEHWSRKLTAYVQDCLQLKSHSLFGWI